MIKNLIKNIFSIFGLNIQRVHNSPYSEPNPIHLWNTDTDFVEIMKQISDHTLVDKVRCFVLYQFIKQTINMPGDIAEVGVYRGGTARLIAESVVSSNKIIHLFDTFSGMPPTDNIKDIHKEKDFRDTTIEAVKSYLTDFKNINYYVGIFPQSAVSIENNVFSIVHIDVDIYKSVMDCCEFFYPRIVRGGIMVFDDYGFLSCPGAKIAVEEFFLDKLEKFIYLPTGQCFIMKL